MQKICLIFDFPVELSFFKSLLRALHVFVDSNPMKLLDSLKKYLIGYDLKWDVSDSEQEIKE